MRLNTEVRIYFRQTGKKGDYQTDIAVYDNGKGMSPNVLKVATSFGGSTSFNNRADIGRFGMGMKTAARGISPVLELYSWQGKEAYYSMTLDVEAVGKERANLVVLPDPRLQQELPAEITDLFVKPVGWPTLITRRSRSAFPLSSIRARFSRPPPGRRDPGRNVDCSSITELNDAGAR